MWHLLLIDTNEFFVSSGLVGGMKFVKKNFTVNFDVVVQDGPIAVLLVDITMHIVVWHVQAIFGLNQKLR